MAHALDLVGRPPPRGRDPGFETLLRIIVDQQVSVQAGAAIWHKLETGLGGEVTPEAVRFRPPDELRNFGLSRPKARYARCLADAITDGTLALAELERMDDQAVRDALTCVTGIGRWTADIYLMFALGRDDVWPAGDLALAVAAERLLGLNGRPTPEEMDAIGERWKPWRTTAAVMLWHYYKKAPLS